MRHRIGWTLALLMIGTAPVLQAQRPTGRAVLEGSVRDSVTGKAVARAHVCASPSSGRVQWSACAKVDTSSAAYRLDSLPQGRWHVRVICGTVGILGRSIGSDSVTVGDSAAVRRDWVVATTGCDPRPLRRVEGTFRGYYTPGFESSEFVPCASDAWFLPGDSLRVKPYDERRAWARLQRASLPVNFVWPRVSRDKYGNPRYYVEWRGTVVGPGHYGHMGVSPFEFHVDRVLTLRAPRRGDCRQVSRG